MFQLDYKSGTPICDQIVNGFIRLKALGILSGGEQMPSVRALASQFSVNPNTVQKAYALLEQSGVIYSVKGKGSFISDDERSHSAIIENAKSNFSVAVKKALDLGLTENDLIECINKEAGK